VEESGDLPSHPATLGLREDLGRRISIKRKMDDIG
jgi:hypothetical protein